MTEIELDIYLPTIKKVLGILENHHGDSTSRSDMEKAREVTRKALDNARVYVFGNVPALIMRDYWMDIFGVSD